MKKNILTLMAGISLLFASCFGVQAQARKQQINSFSHVPKLVEKIGNPAATLIVMDDDDTLLMMRCDKSNCQYLGGPAWYGWQSTLLKNYLQKKADSTYRVADNEQQLLDIASLLLAISNMNYTEYVIPEILQNMAGNGVRLLVETARGNRDVAATHRQFTKLEAGTTSFAGLIEKNGLVFEQADIASLASPFFPCNISGLRAVSYQQGILYVSGQNKGVLLKYLLDKYNSELADNKDGIAIKHIIFIDDTLQNVIDVYNVFNLEKKYSAYALHYTALQEHKSALTQGPNKDILQKIANIRWQSIKSVLKSNLTYPNLPCR